ncbi:hypothetical protein CCAX7_57740 [Capsulimonas corticalis]|uniref:Uncharacterized protein n=1 Tax=Capsulimonas corticalis TaxID=2219043 RepID=A0A402D048_9BACT|nr:hypothetical protein [Capsulimonas corticalis]BDI33723.1 hypothetical protein CCAX7_57740 [Capsulimonas corticalis]
MKYFLYANQEFVGWSALEHADPAMGCVSGVFHPNENYENIKDIILKYSACHLPGTDAAKKELDQVWPRIEALGLAVEPEGCSPFEPTGGVIVIDYAEDLGDEIGRELHVFGLSQEIFAEYFPEAHDRYWGVSDR